MSKSMSRFSLSHWSGVLFTQVMALELWQRKHSQKETPFVCPCLYIGAVVGLLDNKIPGAGVEALSAHVCPRKSLFSVGLWAQQWEVCARAVLVRPWAL